MMRIVFAAFAASLLACTPTSDEVDAGHKVGASSPNPTSYGVECYQSGLPVSPAIHGDGGQVLTDPGDGGCPYYATPAGGFDAGAVPWATPGTIGSTTPNTGVFTTLSSTSIQGTAASAYDAGSTHVRILDPCVTMWSGSTEPVRSCVFKGTTTDGTTWTSVGDGWTSTVNSSETIAIDLTATDVSNDGGTAVTGNMAWCNARFIVTVSNAGTMRITPEFGDSFPSPTSPVALTNLSCTGALNDAGGVGPAVSARVSFSGLVWWLQVLGVSSTTIKWKVQQTHGQSL